MPVLSFYKMSPGGNTTILVLSPPPEGTLRASNANTLMDTLHLGAEQVGYVQIDADVPRLDMMGGEFCGNAARSFAALLAHQRHPMFYEEDKVCPAREGGKLSEAKPVMKGRISVSGVEESLDVCVVSTDHGYDASVSIPVHSHGITCSEEKAGICVVRMEGISHILIDSAAYPMPAGYKEASMLLRSEFGLTNEEAVGCIWYSSSPDGVSIEPVVWVRETDSTHYETGCGSGTIALAATVALHKLQNVSIDVMQPSGKTIRADVTLDADGNVDEAWIGGEVTIIATGETYL